MVSLVIASGNAGKVRELKQSLADFDFDLRPQSDFNCISPEETGLSFIENALIKARSIAGQTGLSALADDSGLMVHGLNDRPGVFSARFAGEHACYKENIKKVLSELGDNPNRTATFCCVLALVRNASDPLPIIAEGTWTGEIVQQPSGNAGFGYDPIFYLQAQRCTAAELSTALKNKLSHRGQAVAILKKKIAENL